MWNVYNAQAVANLEYAFKNFLINDLAKVILDFS